MPAWDSSAESTALAGDGAGQLGKARHHLGVVQGKEPVVVAAALEVHHAVAHADGGKAASRLCLVEAYHIVSGHQVRGQVVVTLGGGEEPVAEILPGDDDGLKEVRVFQCAHA